MLAINDSSENDSSENNSSYKQSKLFKGLSLIVLCTLLNVIYRLTCPGECEDKCLGLHFETWRMMCFHLAIIACTPLEMYTFIAVPVSLFGYAQIDRISIFQVNTLSFNEWYLATKIIFIISLILLLLTLIYYFYISEDRLILLALGSFLSAVLLAGFLMQTCQIHFHHQTLFFILALWIQSPLFKHQILKGIAIGIMCHSFIAYKTLAMFGDGSCDCCTKPYQCCFFGSCREATCKP